MVKLTSSTDVGLLKTQAALHYGWDYALSNGDNFQEKLEVLSSNLKGLCEGNEIVVTNSTLASVLVLFEDNFEYKGLAIGDMTFYGTCDKFKLYVDDQLSNKEVVIIGDKSVKVLDVYNYPE